MSDDGLSTCRNSYTAHHARNSNGPEVRASKIGPARLNELPLFDAVVLEELLRPVRICWIIAVIAALLTGGTIRGADYSVAPMVSRIPRDGVESSGLARVGYSKRLRALEVEFHHGRIYRYEEVPSVVYSNLLAAPSKTRFYNERIRGKYRCLRVKPRGQG